MALIKPEEFRELATAEAKIDYLYEQLFPLLQQQENAGFWQRRALAKAGNNGR